MFEEHDENLKVYGPNGGYLLLNARLLTKQKAWLNLEDIKNVHRTKLDIYEAIKQETNKEILKSFASDLTMCEFELQRLWLFPQDAKFHKFWETPKCECPKMDNDERYPSGYYITNFSCPLHGGKQ